LEIRIVIPTGKDQSTLDRLQNNFSQVSSPKVKYSFSFLSEGPELDAPSHEITAILPYLMHKIKEGEKEGVQAIVIAHYLDPGLEASREIVSTPVIGFGHTTFRLASMLARRISIICSVRSHLGTIEEISVAESLSRKVVSIRSVEITRGDDQSVSQPNLDQLFEVSRKAVEQDGAKLIVLALDGYDDLSGQVKEHLKSCGNSIPVLDPLKVTIKHAENLVNMKASHSKITYPNPESKEVFGYDLNFD
jgi:allantoin racemase